MIMIIAQALRSAEEYTSIGVYSCTAVVTVGIPDSEHCVPVTGPMENVT